MEVGKQGPCVLSDMIFQAAVKEKPVLIEFRNRGKQTISSTEGDIHIFISIHRKSFIKHCITK
jgi:hypothetical protein